MENAVPRKIAQKTRNMVSTFQSKSQNFFALFFPMPKRVNQHGELVDVDERLDASAPRSSFDGMVVVLVVIFVCVPCLIQC